MLGLRKEKEIANLLIQNLPQNMIDGAAFIGVGFDGRGKYSPESRKMSIIQRSCGGRQ